MDQVLVGVPAVLWVGLLVWVTVFGGAASFVASTKGRDTIAWFLFGVLIGPFATVVVGLAGESHEGTSGLAAVPASSPCARARPVARTARWTSGRTSCGTDSVTVRADAGFVSGFLSSGSRHPHRRWPYELRSGAAMDCTHDVSA